MHRMINLDPRNAERIKPYLGGDEINNTINHSHHRYVIDFGDMKEVEARRWPDLFGILETKVRPNRDAGKRDGRRLQSWWQYARRQEALYEAHSYKKRVIAVNCGACPYMAFAFVGTNYVFSNTVTVIALDTYSSFAVLQSRLHEIWARRNSSSFKDDLRYTSTDCFETFPLCDGFRIVPGT